MLLTAAGVICTSGMPVILQHELHSCEQGLHSSWETVSACAGNGLFMGNSMPIRDMDMFASYQRPSSGALTEAGRPAVPSQGSVQVSPDTSLQLSRMG